MTRVSKLDHYPPRRVQRKRKAGWRMPEGVISCTRPGEFGNPFHVGETIVLPRDGGASWLDVEITPALAVALHDAWLDEHPEIVERMVEKLKGHDLACWCRLGDPCHVDNILRRVNAPLVVEILRPPICGYAPGGFMPGPDPMRILR